MSDETIPRQAWLALAVSTLVVFLVVIDISAVNVAFPSIREDFEVSRTALSWIISGYAITVGALLMMAGRYADSIGRRKVYLPGVAIFALGSLLCGLAPSLPLLIAARLIQGVGGAITTASGFAVMLPEFPASRRSTAIGIAGATGALGAVAGPVIGSLLIDLWSWRAIFLMNVPICLIVLLVGPRFLNESKDPNATGNIDRLGVAIGTAAVALIMFGIVQSETWGLLHIGTLGPVVVGLTLVPVLIRRCRTHPEPLIDLSLFEIRSFASTNFGVIFYGLAFTAGFLTNSLVLQDVWLQPIRTVGLALMPAPLLAGVVSPFVGRLADRHGHRWILTLGCGFCGLGYLLYGLLLNNEPEVYTLFVPLGLFVGLGIGMTVATWSSAGISEVPMAQFGVAGATYNTFRQAAYALGVAVAITLIATGSAEVVDGPADIRGYRWAWLWCAGGYFAAAVAIWWTFPDGSAAERQADTREPAQTS